MKQRLDTPSAPRTKVVRGALQSVKEPLFSLGENRVLVYLGIKISNI